MRLKLIAAAASALVLCSTASAGFFDGGKGEAPSRGPARAAKVFGGYSIVLTNQKWVCRGAVDIDLVHVVRDDGEPVDAVSINSGCTGVIHSLVVEVENGADGVKVQNASLTNPAHDLVVENFRVRVLDHPIGVHQDGMQIMGGRNLSFQNGVCYAPKSALGCFAVSRAGGLQDDEASNPTNVICQSCKLGPVKGLRIGASEASGAVDTVTCGLSVTAAAKVPVLVNVLKVPNGDARCQA